MGHTFNGDHGPVKVMHNGQQIAGAIKAQATGTGRVELGEGIYNSGLPSVIVHGEGKQDGTPTPDNPIEPVFLEGASVGSRGRNLVDITPFTTPRILSSSGFAYFDDAQINKILGAPNGEYNISYQVSGDGASGSYKGLFSATDKAGDWIFQAVNKFTIDNDLRENISRFVVYGNVGGNITFSSFMLSAEKIPYEPYYDGGTAPLPILRALPDGSVRDEIDVVSGTVMRRIGEIVLDENSNIRKNKFFENIDVYSVRPINMKNRSKLVSSHFIWDGSIGSEKTWAGQSINFGFLKDARISTEELCQTWLKEQKNNGSPLMFAYALGTPIIEHYDPAILRQHPGYTRLIQQGGFREAEIEAEYWKEM